MSQLNIQLSEDEIERLINGKTISIPVGNTNINADTKQINIMQSLEKDMAAPLINYENKVISKAEINNIKLGAVLMAEQMSAHASNTFKLGS